MFCSAAAFSQAETERWGVKENPYLLKEESGKRDYSLREKSFASAAVKIFIMGYWFFISDLDGDNCPFYPSCSSFLMQSAKNENIFKAGLMFGDRFTRDINIFGRDSHYPVIKNNRYFDPSELYASEKEKVYLYIIKNIPERK
jgi:putative component of membrane protein insertase Oxa1/YidC/SpoIIIJ protein YidD